ncbi:MAG TPA: hypothetical protein VMI31_13955 [Fimbriimonadaceae bacterium]|nr:hypothetical protein [Fimbriimonadaceae bacterium]
MQRISASAIEEVRKALREYELEVEKSGLAEKSKWTYLRHADTFVRWLAGDFEPGKHVSRW